MTVLTTDRLVLRRPEPRDARAHVAYYGTERSAGNGGPQPPGQAWRSFCTLLGHWQSHGYGMWCVTRAGEDKALGMVGPWCPIDWPENEIGWMLFEGAVEGSGIAFEAAVAALDHAFGTLGWNTAVSYIHTANQRSIRLAERLGAMPDPDAIEPPVDHPTLVFRHPKREGRT
jgi:RimJ/RimL family protein N-acetyltransferase